MLHAKPGLRACFEATFYRPGSVNTAVIRLRPLILAVRIEQRTENQKQFRPCSFGFSVRWRCVRFNCIDPYASQLAKLSSLFWRNACHDHSVGIFVDLEWNNHNKMISHRRTESYRIGMGTICLRQVDSEVQAFSAASYTLRIDLI